VLICAIWLVISRVVHRVQRVLVLHLRDQQLQEAVGAARLVGVCGAVAVALSAA
jgi:hypothetical protein